MSHGSVATGPTNSPSGCTSPGGKRKADPVGASSDSRQPSRTVSDTSNSSSAQSSYNMYSFRITPPPRPAPTTASIPSFKRLAQGTLPFASSLPERKPEPVARAPPTPVEPFEYEASDTGPDLTEGQMEVRVRVRRRLLEFGNIAPLLPQEIDKLLPSMPLRLLFTGKMSYAEFSPLRRLLREQWPRLALAKDDIAICLGIKTDLIDLWLKHPTNFASLNRQSTVRIGHDDSPDEEIIRVTLPPPPLPPAPPKLKWRGLDNYGNTCYVNVIVQALFFCPGFLDALSQYVATTSEMLANEVKLNIRRAKTHGWVLMFALNELLHDMNPDAEQSSNNALSNFLREMRLCDKRFQGARQQDAQEFLNFVLLSLHATVLEFHKPPPLPMQSHYTARPTSALAAADSDEATASDEDLLAPQGKRVKVDVVPLPSPPPLPTSELLTQNGTAAPLVIKSFVSDLFEGKLEMRIKCLECECSSAKPEPFMDLSLSLLGNREARSLEAILKDFFHSERLGGRDKFSCDHCHAKTEARKGYVFFSLPPILTLHLKRFSYESQRKICSHLMPPLETTFDAYCQTKDENAHAKYRLYAIVFHAGYFANSGHYRCIVRQGRRWLLFDDEDVSELTEREFLTLFPADVESSNTAYILFYHRLRPGDELDSVDSPAVDRLAAEAMAEMLPTSVEGATDLPTQVDFMSSDTSTQPSSLYTYPSHPATLSVSKNSTELVAAGDLALLSNVMLMESSSTLHKPAVATSHVMAGPAEEPSMELDSALTSQASHHSANFANPLSSAKLQPPSDMES